MRQLVGCFVAAIACCTLAAWSIPCAAQPRFPRLQQLMEQNRTRANEPNILAEVKKNLIEIRPSPEPIPQEIVAKLVKPLGDAIHVRPENSAPFRIAVFPFADKAWDAENQKETSERLSLRSIELQGAINSALRNGLKVAAPNRFLLLDSFGLQREFERAGVDPVSISPDNKQLPELLRELRIDAAVVGRISDAAPNAAEEVQWEEFPSSRFMASIVFAEVERPKAIVPVKLFSPQETLLGGQKRIQFSLQCRTNERANWEDIPIVSDNQQQVSELFAVLEPRQAKAEYRVVVTNAGHQPDKYESFLGAIINPDPAKEKNRVFGVAVLIDGVNSFYQDTGSGELGPVALHPTDAKKWLLAPPGYTLFADKDGKPWLQSSDPDHATVSVAGFQKGDKQAEAFQFAKVAALGGDKGVVAETLGISQSIGLISIYVFARKFAGDKTFRDQATPFNLPSIGTAAGRKFANPIVNLKMDFHPQPVLQFHINYRLRDEIPIPKANWHYLSP
jgi:hypothetical protein